VGLRQVSRRRHPRPVRQSDPPAPPLRALSRRHQALMQVTRADFIALPVEDLGRADAFYGDTLGLARNPNSSGERWVEYETGNLTLALSQYGGGLALRVADVPDTRSELEEAGTPFSMDPFDSGVCNGAPFSDPDGNPLLFH